MAAPRTPLLDELSVPGRDVLDVGCGEGGLALRLARAGARVSAVDPQPAVLERARARTPEGVAVRFVEGSAQALPFEDQSFDAVVFFNSLHHVPVAAMDAALREAARVLRAGGRLYVQEPLARGESFELMRPVEDETDMRSAAQDALARADGATLREMEAREVAHDVVHADFTALRRHLLTVDPARADAFAEHEQCLHEAFAHSGRTVEGGRAFSQPLRVVVFERLGRGERDRVSSVPDGLPKEP